MGNNVPTSNKTNSAFLKLSTAAVVASLYEPLLDSSTASAREIISHSNTAQHIKLVDFSTPNINEFVNERKIPETWEQRYASEMEYIKQNCQQANWNEENENPVSNDCIKNVKELISKLPENIKKQLSYTIPLPDGSIYCNFQDGKNYIGISVKDNRFVYDFHKEYPNEEPGSGTRFSINSIIKLINSYYEVNS